MTRILLISGSTRDRSLHSAALRTATRLAPAEITTVLYDGLRGLPAFVPGEPTPPDEVTRLRDEVAAADVLLFSTPEYAGSLPGSLKNLLDWLVAGGELHDKPAAWLSVAAPGQDEGARAALETALGHGNARLLHWACTRIPLDLGAVGADGVIDDPQLHRAILDILQALGRFLATPAARKQPSWQAYSSVFPVITKTDTTAFDRWRAGRHAGS
ncbi:NADPH-dependent FMN reductase [Micromonosporaceae bacterium Da 78-11]